MKQPTGRTCRILLMLGALFSAQLVYSGAYDDMLRAVNTRDAAQVSALIQRGMDVNTTDPDGNTLLMLAARNGDNQILEILLTNKPNILKINKYGDSALMLAALRGHLQSVRALVAAGADIDPVGWTPLIYAAFEGYREIVEFLLTLDIDIDAQSASGISALMAASRNGHLEIAHLLLRQGADVNLVNQDNKTAMGIALAGKHSDIASLLQQAGGR